MYIFAESANSSGELSRVKPFVQQQSGLTKPEPVNTIFPIKTREREVISGRVTDVKSGRA